MATKEQKAREAGIDVRTNQSDYRTTCPVCSPTRRKRKDPCLHVTIKSDAVLASCFHCDFKGAWFNDDERRRDAPAGRRPGGQKPPQQRPPRWW